ncbi:hypothetical protein QZH41_000067 [Actinostola sp. cb2023]|nr:hypothetical protein QZH41_000067 [Actinostola sp. cb2023]
MCPDRKRYPISRPQKVRYIPTVKGTLYPDRNRYPISRPQKVPYIPTANGTLCHDRKRYPISRPQKVRYIPTAKGTLYPDRKRGAFSFPKIASGPSTIATPPSNSESAAAQSPVVTQLSRKRKVDLLISSGDDSPIGNKYAQVKGKMVRLNQPRIASDTSDSGEEGQFSDDGDDSDKAGKQVSAGRRHVAEVEGEIDSVAVASRDRLLGYFQFSHYVEYVERKYEVMAIFISTRATFCGFLYEWLNVLSFHGAVLLEIERGMLSWSGSFAHLENRTLYGNTKSSSASASSSTTATAVSTVLFCQDHQRSSCSNTRDYYGYIRRVRKWVRVKARKQEEHREEQDEGHIAEDEEEKDEEDPTDTVAVQEDLQPSVSMEAFDGTEPQMQHMADRALPRPPAPEPEDNPPQDAADNAPRPAEEQGPADEATTRIAALEDKIKLLEQLRTMESTDAALAAFRRHLIRPAAIFDRYEAIELLQSLVHLARGEAHQKADEYAATLDEVRTRADALDDRQLQQLMVGLLGDPVRARIAKEAASILKNAGRAPASGSESPLARRPAPYPTHVEQTQCFKCYRWGHVARPFTRGHGGQSQFF